MSAEATQLLARLRDRQKVGRSTIAKVLAEGVEAPAVAVDILDHVHRTEQWPSLMPPLASQNHIRIAIDCGRTDIAGTLLSDARRHHARKESTWAKLASAVSRSGSRRVRQAAEQGRWSAAFDELRYTELVASDHPEIVQAARAHLQDWSGVLRLESSILRQRKLSSAAELPLEFLRPCVSARLQLGMTDEALTLFMEHQAHSGSSQELRQIEAGLRARSQDYARAIEIRLDLWKAGVDSVFSGIVEDLITTGDVAAAGRFLQEAKASGRSLDTKRLIWSEVGLHRAMGDHKQALNLVLDRQGEAVGDSHLAKFAALAAANRRTDIMSMLLDKANTWTDDTITLQRYAGSIASVVDIHWRCLSNWRLVEHCLSTLEGQLLSPDTGGRVANVRVAEGRYGAGLSTLQRSLAAFPSSPRLWKQLLRMLGAAGDRVKMQTARTELESRLPPKAVLGVLAGSDATAWTPTDIPKLLAYMSTTAHQGNVDTFFSSLAKLASPSTAEMDVLGRLTSSLRGPNAVKLEIMRATATDHRLLRTATLQETPFSRFMETRAQTFRQVEASLRGCTSAEVIPAQGAKWLENCLDALAAIESKAQRSTSLSGLSFADAARAATELAERILRKQPTSAIRIGDGEGGFLPPHPDCAAYVAEDREEIQRIWWGDARPTEEFAITMERDLRRALDRADIVGVVPFSRLAFEGLQRDVKRCKRGLLNSLAYLADSSTELRSVASAYFHQDLQAWNLWPEIFSSLESASWISCHDLADYLWTALGLRTRRGIMIPPEHKYGSLFNPDREQLETAETLLDRHDDICAAIEPKPGEVFLVAAGFLGKIYCDLIRERGGIGIDIGSIADYWMGYATHAATRLDHGPPLAIANALVTQLPLPNVDTSARMIGNRSSVRSTRDGRYNIGSEQDAIPAERQRKLLRVVGHPRCGSRFMVTLFSDFGIEIGHELMLRDGIASWLHAVQDHAIPYGDNSTYALDFDHTVGYVRNPADAIPSIMLENGEDASFNFRRQHILRATGDDIARYSTQAERALASFLHWNAMVSSLQPAAVFQVELAENGVKDWLASWRPSMDITGEAKGVTGSNATRTAQRFQIDKPELSEGDWLSIDQALLDGLAAFCASFGYQCPWDSSGARPAAT